MSEPRRFVISGCSGGGKSTLIAEMASRGYAIRPEPGHEILRDQLAAGGNALPWTDMAGFLELCITRGEHFFNTAARENGIVLFDRSIVDAVSALHQHGFAVRREHHMALERQRYETTVFMAPPWEDLFASDSERQHSFADAVAEHEALMRFYRPMATR